MIPPAQGGKSATGRFGPFSKPCEFHPSFQPPELPIARDELRLACSSRSRRETVGEGDPSSGLETGGFPCERPIHAYDFDGHASDLPDEAVSLFGGVRPSDGVPDFPRFTTVMASRALPSSARRSRALPWSAQGSSSRKAITGWASRTLRTGITVDPCPGSVREAEPSRRPCL